jgi:hypothetical protein
LKRQRPVISDGIRVDFYGGVSGNETRSSGLMGSSATGPVALPGFGSSSFSGNIGIEVDLSGLLHLDRVQRLIVAAGVSGNASSLNTSAAGLSGFSTGSSVTVPLGVGYKFGNNYLVGVAAFESGHDDFANTSTGASGRAGYRGSAGDITVGHLFELWNAKRSDGTVREPNGWRGLMLDLSGHVGTIDQHSSSFVDSTGTFNNGAFAYRNHGGIDARLTGYYKVPNFWITPCVQVGADYAFSDKIAVSLDPTGLSVAADRTAGRVEAGITATAINQVSLTARTYYMAGSTTQSVGGSIVAHIPIGAR